MQRIAHVKHREPASCNDCPMKDTSCGMICVKEHSKLQNFTLSHTEISSPIITTGESALYTYTGRLNAMDMARNSIWPPHSTLVKAPRTYHSNFPPWSRNRQSQYLLQGSSKTRPCADAYSWQLFDELPDMPSFEPSKDRPGTTAPRLPCNYHHRPT